MFDCNVNSMVYEMADKSLKSMLSSDISTSVYKVKIHNSNLCSKFRKKKTLFAALKVLNKKPRIKVKALPRASC